MYNIFPKSLKEFIEDSSIKLPRFQRKASWKEKDRFELALSVFKNYPLGASILSSEANTSWLLDGRQRRDTLTAIYNNPENLYTWGKKYLPIKANYSIDKLTEVFWSKVADFIEADEGDNNDSDESNDGNDEGTDESDSNPQNEKSDNQLNYQGDQQELPTLLAIIKIAFQYKRGSMSGLTSSFDFQDFLTGKAFINGLYVNKEGKQVVDCAKLRNFIHDYVQDTNNFSDYEEFITYLDNKYDWKNESVSKAQLKNKLSSEWGSRQLEIIKSFNRIDSMFMDRKIAIVSTSSITSTDSQKIFNLINTGGTTLSASEILSAKPKWNAPVSTPDQKLEHAIQKLYDNLDLGNSSASTVKWDIPASLTYFLDNEENNGLSFFFEFDDNKGISNRITIGFKLLSGFVSNGVKKEDIDNLSSKIDWNNYQELISQIKDFFDSFKNNIYLKNIKSWGKCLSDILSDGPTMNFLFILYRNWLELNKPTAYQSTERKIYDKNIFILLDESFYRYLSNQWKGSSDSTIAKNIAAYSQKSNNNSNHLFNTIPTDSWNVLLNEISVKNELNGKAIVKNSLMPLVHFYNIIKNIEGKGSNEPGEIDHIMPQSLWESANIENKEAILNNVFNLALLPKDTNDSKNNAPLRNLRTNRNLISEIIKYEEIEENDFETYSELNNYKTLKRNREAKYKEAFNDLRERILNNA